MQPPKSSKIAEFKWLRPVVIATIVIPNRLKSNYEAACRLWSDWRRSYCSQSPAAVLLRQIDASAPQPMRSKAERVQQWRIKQPSGRPNRPAGTVSWRGSLGPKGATMSSTQSVCQKHRDFKGPRPRRQTYGRNGRSSVPGYNRKKRRSRRAAPVPPIVPQPPASSCRSLNLAGSAKVALGWARSIAR